MAILAGLGDGPGPHFLNHPFPPELMEHMEASGLYAPYLFLRWPLGRDLCAGPHWTVPYVGPLYCS